MAQLVGGDGGRGVEESLQVRLEGGDVDGPDVSGVDVGGAWWRQGHGEVEHNTTVVGGERVVRAHRLQKVVVSWSDDPVQDVATLMGGERDSLKQTKGIHYVNQTRGVRI